MRDLWAISGVPPTDKQGRLPAPLPGFNGPDLVPIARVGEVTAVTGTRAAEFVAAVACQVARGDAATSENVDDPTLAPPTPVLWQEGGGQTAPDAVAELQAEWRQDSSAVVGKRQITPMVAVLPASTDPLPELRLRALFFRPGLIVLADVRGGGTRKDRGPHLVGTAQAIGAAVLVLYGPADAELIRPYKPARLLAVTESSRGPAYSTLTTRDALGLADLRMDIDLRELSLL